MKNKILVTLIISLVLLFVLPQYPYSQEWFRVTQNERQYVEIDLSSIKRGDNTFTVWIKTGYRTHEAKEYYISRKIYHLEKNGAKVPKGLWDDWGYSIVLHEFDCDNDNVRFLVFVDYRNDGSIIQRIDYKERDNPFLDIVPQSSAYAVQATLCKLYYLEYMGEVFGLFFEDALEVLNKYGAEGVTILE